MKFLFISDVGNALGAALKVQAEGNKVACWFKDPSASSVGKNMVVLADRKFPADFDTTHVFDCTGTGHFADALRMGGFPVAGGSVVADDMEGDREFWREIASEAKIPSPPTKFFEHWKDGYEFVRANKGKRFVIKPAGHLSGNLPSHVADKEFPTEDLLGTLDHYERTFAGDPEFEIQSFIPGVDISTEAWFYDGEMVEPSNHTLEVKSVNDGDRGATGGCAGNVVWPCDDWIVDQTLRKLSPVLKKHRFCGPLDVNVIVSEEGKLFQLEATPRWGFDAEPTWFFTSLDMELGQFFSDFARGQLAEIPLKPGFAAGVRVTIPPYPSDDSKSPSGLPILGLSDKALSDWFYCYDCMKTSEGSLVSAGSYGLIGVACAYDGDLHSAMMKATERAKQVHISEAQFRLDLADTFQKDYVRLGMGQEYEAPDKEAPEDKPNRRRLFAPAGKE